MHSDDKFQTVSGCIHLLPPADVRFVSGFLRTDVGIELVGHILVPDAEVSAMVAVAVVLNRAASVE